jgi:phenylacetate-CoA ligase
MSAVASLAPALRRHVLEPIWARTTGASVLQATQQLERAQYLPAETIRQRQWQAFVELAKYVYSNNDFYRSKFDAAGFAPAHLSDWADLRRVPILTKAEVRAGGLKLLSAGMDPNRLMKAKTGGSTGKPIEVFFTEHVSQLRNAIGRRNKDWAGWRPGEPVGAVWGNPVYPSTLKGRLREWVLSPTIYLDTMRMSDEAVTTFARDWTRTKPTMLFGHAHSLYVLATIVRRLAIDAIKPNAILPTSMMMPAYERKVIEEVFGAKATDIYGCEEVGLIAGECEKHDGLHLNVEQLIVEVVRPDGSEAGPGETGAVIVTDLLNRAMPFIRYRIEDMAEVADHPCICGRAIPTVRRVIGRTADFLRRRDGSRVAGISLIENTLTDIAGIDQMQIVQESIERLVVRIVPGADLTPANRAALANYFAATFPGTDVELQDVAAIPAEPNGKYRFSICRIAD